MTGPDDRGQVCQRCGTPRSGDASFCPVCDTFLEWHDDATPVAPVAPVRPVAAGTGGTPPAPTPPRPAEAPPAGDRVRAPVVSTDAGEVEVAVTGPGTVALAVRNGSTIVDSYDVAVVDAPPWLVVTHGDTNLLPDEARTVPVTLAVRPGALAVAQRLAVVLRTSSTVSAERYADVPLTVVVPPSGPPASVVAHPTLVRLQDRGEASFTLHLDNRASNHARRYRLGGSDPEGVVRLDFVPSVVDVAAGETAGSTVRFAAPQPPPGEDVTRQLTITATDDEGPVTVQATVVQATSPEPEKHPVTLRLEPSQVTAVDTGSAGLGLVVDNRAGLRDAVVDLRGRDPAGAVLFGFDHQQLLVGAGRAVRIGMRVTAATPPRGGSVTRPFSVLARTDDGESEVAGTLELTSRPAAISTAQVRLLPDHLAVRSRRGTYTVEVDNRQGGEPLHVVLSGADEFGRARLRFSPDRLGVGPGQVGRSTLVVQHPRPEGGRSATRRIRVAATAGADAVHGEAAFTQQSESHRRWWAVLVGLLGTALVALGVWLYADPLDVTSIRTAADMLVGNAEAGTTPAESDARLAGAALALGLALLCVVFMLLGLTGRTGKALRVGAIVAALAAVGATVSAEVTGGLPVVLGGAVVAYVGGVLLRS